MFSSTGLCAPLTQGLPGSLLAALAGPVATGLTVKRASRPSREAGAERVAMPPHLRGLPSTVSEMTIRCLAIQGILGQAKRETRERPDPQVQRLIAPMAEMVETDFREEVVTGELAALAAIIRGPMETVQPAGKGGWAETEQVAWVLKEKIAVSLRVETQEMAAMVEAAELVKVVMEASEALGAARGPRMDSAELVDPEEWAAQAQGAQGAKEVMGVMVETASSSPERAVVPVQEEAWLNPMAV